MQLRRWCLHNLSESLKQAIMIVHKKIMEGQFESSSNHGNNNIGVVRPGD
jgi:hypothetical protein